MIAPESPRDQSRTSHKLGVLGFAEGRYSLSACCLRMSGTVRNRNPHASPGVRVCPRMNSPSVRAMSGMSTRHWHPSDKNRSQVLHSRTCACDHTRCNNLLKVFTNSRPREAFTSLAVSARVMICLEYLV